jgi:NDP-sugar pyrophosphorylase family protein
MGVNAVNPFEERWKPTFALVEEGALVSPGARLYDSVVLSGGTVGPGAEVVRSVVGMGGVVRRRQRVVGRLVVGDESELGRRRAPAAGSDR